ncbi:hypothetical protein ACVXG9_17775 [Escherichia coli]
MLSRNLGDCLQQTQGHPDASLLLWRGVEMVEILSTLSMDIDTLRRRCFSLGGCQRSQRRCAA